MNFSSLFTSIEMLEPAFIPETLLQRMSPSQSRELGKVPVHRNPFTSRFYRQSRKIGIGYQIAPGTNLLAYLSEDIPMSRPRSNDQRVRLVAHLIGKGNRVLNCVGV